MNGKYGLPGYDAYLLPKAIEWYLGGVTPLEKEWILEQCYERDFLNPYESKKLLMRINAILPEHFQIKGEIKYISPKVIQKKNS